MLKHESLAQRMIMHMNEIFSEDCEYYIGSDEIEANTNEFFQALGNMLPLYFYNKLTGADSDVIDFNAACVRLILQFTTPNHPSQG